MINNFRLLVLKDILLSIIKGSASVLVFIIIFLNSKSLYASSVHLGLRIHYQTGMSHVEKKDMPVVEMLRRISIAVPKSKFLISGHTDIVGSYEMNVELSRSRADIIKLLLVRYGVDEDRIQSKWLSYDAPIASNDTEEGRSQNRRTVATVYGLTDYEAKSLALAASKSKRFYVIGTENEQVTDLVTDVLEPQLIENITVAPSEKIKEQSLVEIETQAELTAKPEPVVLAKPKKVRIPSNKHRYFVGWAVTDNELSAENKLGLYSAVWITDFNQSLSLGYQYKIKNKYWFGLSGTYGLQNYRLVQNPIFTWDGITPNVLRVSANLDYEANARLAFGFDINYAEENFIISDSGVNIFLRKAALFGVSGRSSYRFYDSNNISSRLKVSVELPFVGGGDIEAKGLFGAIAGADMTFKRWMKSHEINLGVYVGLRSFENIENTQDETVAGFEIKFRNKRWP